jgi:hypothetical protein
MSTSTKSKPTIPKPYLEFKYNQVCMLGDLGDGASHFVPARMVNKPVPLQERMVRNPSTGRLEVKSEYITTPEFDLDHVHCIELKPELAVLPKKLPGQSVAHYEKLCDLSYETAMQAKVYNDRIREKVYHYVDSGVLTLVSDPFDTRDDAVIEGLEESAAIEPVKPATKAKTTRATKKAA